MYQAKSKNITLTPHFYGFPCRDPHGFIKPNKEINDFESTALILETDQLRLQQVLLNL